MRIDFVFSYWIFFWFILYKFKIIKYSPKFSLVVAFIENLILLGLMMNRNVSTSTILKFLFINTIIKIMPLYSLKNDTIHKEDICFTIMLFAIYITWLHINNTNIIENVTTIYNSLIYEKNTTSLFKLFDDYYLKN
jgi:hypothetical protein